MPTENCETGLRHRLAAPCDVAALLEFFDRTAFAAYDYALRRTADTTTARRVCLQVYLDIFEMPAIAFGDDISTWARIQILIHLRTEPMTRPAPRRTRLDSIRTSRLHGRSNAHGRRPRRTAVAVPGEVATG